MDIDESSDEDSDEQDSDEEKPLIDFNCEEDDDDEEEGETKKDMKKNNKNYVKAEGDNWVKTLLHNNNFGIKGRRAQW